MMLNHSSASRGKRWIHEDQRGANLRWKNIVNNFRIDAVGFEAEFGCEQSATPRIDLVAYDPRSEAARPDRQTSRAGRWFKNDVTRRQVEQLGRKESECRRGRKLLKFRPLVCAIGLRGQAVRQGAQSCECLSIHAHKPLCLCFQQVLVYRCFEGIVSIARCVDSLRPSTAKGLIGNFAEFWVVEGFAEGKALGYLVD